MNKVIREIIDGIIKKVANEATGTSFDLHHILRLARHLLARVCCSLRKWDCLVFLESIQHRVCFSRCLGVLRSWVRVVHDEIFRKIGDRIIKKVTHEATGAKIFVDHIL